MESVLELTSHATMGKEVFQQELQLYLHRKNSTLMDGQLGGLHVSVEIMAQHTYKPV